MKTIKTAAAIMLAASLFFLACDKNKQKLPVDFKYVLLDTLGNKKTVFSPGENIIFSFQVINESDEDLTFRHPIITDNDFFRVYQPNTPEGTLDYGLPYKNIFCEFMGAITVPKSSSLKIEIPWYESLEHTNGYIGCSYDSYHAEVPTLGVGNYYSEFTQTFEIGDIKTEEKHFKINFTIE